MRAAPRLPRSTPRRAKNSPVRCVERMISCAIGVERAVHAEVLVPRGAEAPDVGDASSPREWLETIVAGASETCSHPLTSTLK